MYAVGHNPTSTTLGYLECYIYPVAALLGMIMFYLKRGEDVSRKHRSQKLRVFSMGVRGEHWVH
jgi:hypothetical protein